MGVFINYIFIINLKKVFSNSSRSHLKELMDIGMKIYVRLSLDHRRGIKTEENSKVVAAAGGQKLFNFLSR